MNSIDIYTGTQVSREMISQAIQLDRISYDDIYQLSVDKCVSYHEKNNCIYIMAIDTNTDKVVGYINFSPVTKTMFDTILSGEVIDTVISPEDIIIYEDGLNCYGYLSSIVVHPKYRQKRLAREMLKNLNFLLYKLADEHKIFFNGIVADAVSEIGHYILLTLGFRDVNNSKHQSQIMKLDLFDEQTFKTKYNEKLFELYERKLRTMVFKYDLFISYATDNKKIADYIVEKIEKRGYKCFIAPRDLRTGADYASEIISAISNSTAVLLVFSSISDKSHYVLREINSAVSRNKLIIPLRIEDFLPSEAMEFYLGPTHWLDAFPAILDVHLDKIINILVGMDKDVSETKEKEISIKGPTLIKIEEIGKIGFNYKDLTMKEIEIDYLCIPSDRFKMNDEIEGTFEDWQNSAQEYENDTSILLIKNDELVGYCDMYPVTEEAYADLISGKVIIRDSMIDLFCMGGEFDVYISMIGIVPEEATQSNYLMIFDWIFTHLDEWNKNDIHINRVGISVYSDMLEKFIKRFGFEYRSINPAKGKVFETTVEDLKNNPNVQKRYPQFYEL